MSTLRTFTSIHIPAAQCLQLLDELHSDTVTDRLFSPEMMVARTFDRLGIESVIKGNDLKITNVTNYNEEIHEFLKSLAPYVSTGYFEHVFLDESGEEQILSLSYNQGIVQESLVSGS